MSEMAENELNEALELLGTLLEDSDVGSISLVVAGGSALVAQKLISRRTHDVDVIAMEWGEVRAYPLPESLKAAAARVARELNLDPNWLNSSISMFLGRDQLPEWLWWSLDTRTYGKSLSVSFIKREGLVLLKLYAAIDRDEARDLADLLALTPTEDEVQRHLTWILGEILGQTTHPKLEAVLNHLGHGHLLSRVQPAAQ